MSDKEVPAESAGGGDSLVEQAGETTAADMVSGPQDTKPVGTDTMVKVGDATGGEKKGGRQ